MPSALVRKLEAADELDEEDRIVLERIAERSRPVDPYRDLVQEGDRPDLVHIVLDGYACRYKLMPEGGRQITALFVPGDLCNVDAALLDRMDHSIGTLTQCTVVEMHHATFRELTSRRPRVEQALRWTSLVDESVLRAWLANLGQRPADKRMAHLFCELLARLRTVGLADGRGCDIPIRQSELGDILGLSSVHVNRTLRDLRGAGLIVLKSRRLDVPDLDRLKAFCGFDPNYLHLTRRKAAERPGRGTTSPSTGAR